MCVKSGVSKYRRYAEVWGQDIQSCGSACASKCNGSVSLVICVAVGYLTGDVQYDTAIENH